MLSIVMPTYNSERFIDETLWSIYNQSCLDYELLIVDGGSTDRTLEIIKKNGNSKTKIISHDDTGIPNALNNGFIAAQGDIFCWLNSNDVYVSKYVIERVNEFFLSTDAEFAIGISYLLDERGKIKKKLHPFSSSANPTRNFGNFFTGSLFFSKEAWQKFEGFSERYRYAFEYELIEYLLNSHRLSNLRFPIAALRAHSDALSNINNTEMKIEKYSILKHHHPSGRFEFIKSRLTFHALHGDIIEVLLNKFIKNKKGKDWFELYDIV